MQDREMRLVDQFHTCEMATIARDGTPVAWPVVAVRERGSESFTVTASVSFAAKAFNIRRDPHVSLHFSDPTGSGLVDPPRILVQGTATCPDEVVTDPTGHQDYWRTVYARQPGGKAYGANAFTRWLTDWYYFRLYIDVVPLRVAESEGEIPDAPAAAGASSARWDSFTKTRDALSGYPSAVLSTVDDDGFPRSARVHPAPGEPGVLVLPAGIAPEGPASLLFHRHDARTARLSNHVAVGDVRQAGPLTTFEIRRELAGASGELRGMIPMLRRARATARGYLERRDLPRPTVPWAAYKPLYR